MERNLQVQQEVGAAVQGLASSHDLVDALERALPPQSEEGIDAVQRRIEAGGGRLLEGLEFMRGHWRLHTAYSLALRDWKQAEIALAYATEGDLQE